MNPRHQATLAAQKIIEHLHNNLRDFDKRLAGDEPSRVAVEDVATALQEILLGLCVDHAQRPAGQPRGYRHG